LLAIDYSSGLRKRTAQGVDERPRTDGAVCRLVTDIDEQVPAARTSVSLVLLRIEHDAESEAEFEKLALGRDLILHYVVNAVNGGFTAQRDPD
jgi:hypothetical protein